MKLRNCKYICSTGGKRDGEDIVENLNVLENHWDCGFYSNHTQTFLSLLILSSHGIVPDKIDYSNGFKCFAPEAEKNLDIYSDFCKIDESQQIPLYQNIFIPDENRKDFGNYQFPIYNPIVKRFFSPSETIENRKKELVEKYKINFSKTISVLYRGTDKWTEVRLAPAEHYLSAVQQILDQTDAEKVLIQTDQTQVLEFFKEKLGDKVIHFEETPSTSGSKAMNAVMSESDKSQIDWMQWFDAALRCVSESAYLVNHTGNCGLWANLYRGNVNNVFQFSQFGVLD
jgi:hypothetical protein